MSALRVLFKVARFVLTFVVMRAVFAKQLEVVRDMGQVR